MDKTAYNLKKAEKQARENRAVLIAGIIIAAVFVAGLALILFLPEHNAFRDASMRVIPYSQSDSEIAIEGRLPNRLQNALERCRFRTAYITDGEPDYILVFEDGDIYFVKAALREKNGFYGIMREGKQGEARTGGSATAELDLIFEEINRTGR